MISKNKIVTDLSKTFYLKMRQIQQHIYKKCGVTVLLLI